MANTQNNKSENTSESAKKASEDLESTGKEAEESKKKIEGVGKALQDLSKGATPLDLLIDKLNDMGGVGTVVAGVFSLIGSAISTAIERSSEFYKSLTQIKGINGQVGNLAKAITTAATGSVSRQDIADFLNATDDIFSAYGNSATAMQEQAGFINDLIGLYQDSAAAADAYRSVILLSSEAQKEYAEYVARANEIMQQTPAARLQTMKNELSELVTIIGNDLLGVLKPLLSMISSIITSVRNLRGQTGTLGLSEEQQYSELQALAEEYGTTLEELNTIQKGGYTSSLDEVHTADMGGVFGAETEADRIQSETEAYDAQAESVGGLDETFKKLGETIAILLDTFLTLFDAVGPGLLDLASGIATVVSAIISWLDNTGLLIPVLSRALGVIVALKVASLMQAAAQQKAAMAALQAIPQIAANTAAEGANAVAKTASAAAGSWGAAVPIILGAVAAGVAGLAMFGIFSSGSGSSGSGSVSTSGTSNAYSGTAQESQKTEVTVYLDGKKVNDGLATEASYSEEVRIT